MATILWVGGLDGLDLSSPQSKGPYLMGVSCPQTTQEHHRKIQSIEMPCLSLECRMQYMSHSHVMSCRQGCFAQIS